MGESGRGCPVQGTAGAHSKPTKGHLQTRLQSRCLWEILKGEKNPTQAEKNNEKKKRSQKIRASFRGDEEVLQALEYQGMARAGAGNEERRKEGQEGTAADTRILPVHVKIHLSSHNLWLLTIPECLFCPCDFEIGSLGEQISWEASILTGCFPG